MRIAIAWLLLIVCLFATNDLRGEVIELEGTVKAVDADARTISIERKTAKGTKTLDLEVNKKAGDLSSVKVGDKLSFSYDPGLELVTKLGSGGGDDKQVVEDDASRKVAKALEGEWLVVEAELNGETVDRGAVRRQNRLVTFKGMSLTMERVQGEKVGFYKGKYEIDAATKTFDFIGKGPAGAAVEWIGLYELDGDTLRLCYRYNTDGTATRPKAFTSKDWQKPNGTVVYTLKRQD